MASLAIESTSPPPIPGSPGAPTSSPPPTPPPSLRSTLPTSSPSKPDSDLIEWEDIELPIAQRIDRAFDDWKEAKGALTQRAVARRWGVNPSTLHGRIHGKASAAKRQTDQQRLLVEEEEVIVKWINRLQAWGWPARVEQVRFMAEDLLRAKGDIEPLGINWIQKLLGRHKEIFSKYIPPLDKERHTAQDPAILIDWFELFHRVKTQYNLHDRDIYNMDEKGFLQGVIGKLKVLLSKHQHKKHMTHCGNREWTTLIECVSLDGRKLRPWIIFKGKKPQLSWHDLYPTAHTTCTENGWTDNEIGLLYFQKCFHPETMIGQTGEYRMLLLDGHASHISTRTIEFCVSHNIILLCLPPHTTHILQPLDVSVFAPLSTAYKQGVHKRTNKAAGYSIDKCDFLEVLQIAREAAVTPQNIQKAWAKAGLSPYNPNLIIRDFLPKEMGTTIDGGEKPLPEQYHITFMTNRPYTPPEATISYKGPSGPRQRVLTPGNTYQVHYLMKKLVDRTATTEEVALIAQKVGRSAILAMANGTILGQTNKQLMDVAQRKDGKRRRRKGHHEGGQVLNQEILNERSELRDFDSMWRWLSNISKDIFGRQKIKKSHAERLVKHQAKSPAKRVLGRAKPRQILARGRRNPPATPARGYPLSRSPTPPAVTTPVKGPATLWFEGKSPWRRSRKLIVRLGVRVTTQELQQGRWRQRQQQQPYEVTEQGDGDVIGQEQFGRGLRVRRPRRA